MKLLSKIHSKQNIHIASLLTRKGVTEYFLYEENYVTHSRAFEVWWYEYRGKNHFLFKHRYHPYYLFFIQLDENEIFTLKDFDYYLDYGTFKKGGVWQLEDIAKEDLT